MSMRDKHSLYWVTALFLAFVLVLSVLHGCKREKPEANPPASPNSVAASRDVKTPTADPIQAATNLFRGPKASLQAIIEASKQKWDAVLPDSWGKPAPDFALADIDGQTHRLSDYRGKDVVLAFWATWGGSCKLQIPHLKELREAYAKDKLAILAVCAEDAAIVKSFVAEQGITYTVLLSTGSLVAPYSEIDDYVPSCLFIDAEGNIKLAIRGIVPTADAKAILQAQ
ncbi:MAG: TlpA family protein disulfide reductase [Phycisphaerae bacterium]|nr:TlpA family protein disulfide reductase [Phycisphaerae bacterium]